VLENYQREDGIEVPKALRKYIPGQPEFLPYVKELPKDSTSNKAKAAKEGEAVKGGVAKVPGEGEVVERTKGKAEEVRS
jgi:seryl-tRNA synthetase